MAIVGVRVAKVREAKHLTTECGLPAFDARSGICDSDQILRIRRGDVPADEALEPLVEPLPEVWATRQISRHRTAEASARTDDQPAMARRLENRVDDGLDRLSHRGGDVRQVWIQESSVLDSAVVRCQLAADAHHSCRLP